MLKNKIKFCILVILFAVMGGGCSSLLPSETRVVKSPWETFDEVKVAYDKIIPYHTTTEDLKVLQLDPYVTPNIELMTYLDLIQFFIPNQSVQLSDLDKSVQDCISSKDSCKGYKFDQRKKKTARFGNVILDVLNFRRKTRISGWEFKALIVMKDTMVVYKIWSGKPQMDEVEDRKNPLGPLQELKFWDKLIPY